MAENPIKTTLEPTRLPEIINFTGKTVAWAGGISAAC